MVRCICRRSRAGPQLSLRALRVTSCGSSGTRDGRPPRAGHRPRRALRLRGGFEAATSPPPPAPAIRSAPDQTSSGAALGGELGMLGEKAGDRLLFSSDPVRLPRSARKLFICSASQPSFHVLVDHRRCQSFEHALGELARLAIVRNAVGISFPIRDRDVLAHLFDGLDAAAPLEDGPVELHVVDQGVEALPGSECVLETGGEHPRRLHLATEGAAWTPRSNMITVSDRYRWRSTAPRHRHQPNASTTPAIWPGPCAKGQRSELPPWSRPLHLRKTIHADRDRRSVVRRLGHCHVIPPVEGSGGTVGARQRTPIAARSCASMMRGSNAPASRRQSTGGEHDRVTDR